MKTDIDTLGEVWTLLDELGLSNLLTGGELKIDINKLMSMLFKEKQLKRFVSLITGKSEAEAGAMKSHEVMECLKAFFTELGNDFKALSGMFQQ